MADEGVIDSWKYVTVCVFVCGSAFHLGFYLFSSLLDCELPFVEESA